MLTQPGKIATDMATASCTSILLYQPTYTAKLFNQLQPLSHDRMFYASQTEISKFKELLLEYSVCIVLFVEVAFKNNVLSHLTHLKYLYCLFIFTCFFIK